MRYFSDWLLAAENGGIKPGVVVAVWGCGLVGQFAMQSARLLGAERNIAIDRIPERLEMARQYAGAEGINFEGQDVVDLLKQMTGGLGPDVCIDAVGMEAHLSGLLAVVDCAKQVVKIEAGRPVALREAIQACRKGRTVSLAGVYGGFLDTVPFEAAFNKGLTLRMGHAHIHRYMEPLLDHIRKGDIDPSFVVTHRLPLAEVPHAHRIFRDKEDSCIKVVLKP